MDSIAAILASSLAFSRLLIAQITRFIDLGRNVALIMVFGACAAALSGYYFAIYLSGSSFRD
ncbi:hypothetical protein ACM615_09415 [Rahnella sp. PAMC25617]|uniref:hypothetical protein n=1 Tax=Rahnella sp. PAMC25617 TaxID=3399684 RepID=UPI003D35CE01